MKASIKAGVKTEGNFFRAKLFFRANFEKKQKKEFCKHDRIRVSNFWQADL
jgi:hypothetical protein